MYSAIREKPVLNYNNANSSSYKKNQWTVLRSVRNNRTLRFAKQSKQIHLDDHFCICHFYVAHKNEIVFHTCHQLINTLQCNV